jgi:hypothetical protein
MTSFLIIDDHPLFRDALGNAIRLAHTDARILEAMSTFGSRGWAQIMSANGSNCEILKLSKFLPGCPPITDIAPIARMVRRAVYRGVSGRPRHRKVPPLRRSARSQAVAVSPGLACGRLRRHSATAKQYCPSSSTVARHFGTELGTPKPAVFALEAATSVRR